MPEGNATSVSISLYREHIDIINDAVMNDDFRNPADVVQTLLIRYDTERLRRFTHNFLLYIFQPFFIVLLLILYAYAINNVWLSIFSGICASFFLYLVVIGTLRMHGKDPKKWGKSKKRRKQLGLE